ncbi:FA complementation group L L homeolog isoform X1 [Xenopus laevis]|uniref:FA complementation group L L homeolog isoform X1 n=1 Tax=Xenopus laevis TaxID=8355 RepID=A0A8J1KLR6_XENLA|nr:FA complementation group L L homeolog isoform X1 [Xenopus laevis]
MSAGGMLRQCPLLIPQDLQGRVYDGFLSIQDKDFRLRVILPEDLQLANAKIECSWKLKKVLQAYDQIVKQRLQHSVNLESFMMELKTILEAALKNTNAMQTPPAPQYYSCLVKDIESLGWDKLSFVDTELSMIQLKIEDTSGRDHLVTLKLNAKYPYEAPDCSVDFPIPFTISWTPQSSLLNIYKQVSSALESLKGFWDALDEIDQKTWVLEPEKPMRSSTMRRIVIGNNVSITIDVDPKHPAMLPECYFLGAEHVVNPLREKLNLNIHLWISAWIVAYVTPIDWTLPYQIKCATTPVVGSLSIKPVCMSGSEVCPPADKASTLYTANVPTVTSPLP